MIPGYSRDEHERQLLAALLIKPEQIASVVVPASAFAKCENREIYLALVERFYSGDACDVTGICEALQDRLPIVGGAVYLNRLMIDAEPTANAGFHATELLKLHTRDTARQVIAQAAIEIDRGDITALPRLREALATIGSEEKQTTRFPVINSRTLAATEIDVRYLIDGIIVEKQPHVWGGPAKGMKTSTALDAAISMATGGHFLGYWPAKQVSGVLFLSGESGLGTLKETASRICGAAGRRLEDIDRLHWCVSLPRLDNEADLRDLRAVMRQIACDTLFIDPMYLCLPGDDASNMFSMGGMLRKLSSAMEADGVTTILLHHTTRAATKDNFEPLDLHSLAWAGITEFARAWVLVNRSERYEDGSGVHRLNLVAGGSAGHSGCWQVTIEEGTRQDLGGRVWRTQVLKRDEARQDAQQRKEEAKERSSNERASRDVQRVLKAFETYPDGVSKSALRDASGLRQSPFDAALAIAIQQRIVEPCKIIRGNKQSYDGYRLAILDDSGPLRTTQNPECSDTLRTLGPIGAVSCPECVTGPRSLWTNTSGVLSGTAESPIPFNGHGVNGHAAEGGVP